MKKIIRILIITLSLFILTGCFSYEQDLYSKDVVEQIDFKNISGEYETTRTSVDLHFFKGDVLPYIDVIEFFELLDGVFLYDDMQFEKMKKN